MSPLRRRLLHSAFGIALLAVGACSGCQNGPSDPPALRVLVEVDQMEGTTPLRPEQVIDGESVSLSGIYAPAGIDLEITVDETDIPRQEDVRLADLHGLMIEHRRTDVQPETMHLYILVATRDHEEENTLGVMFDFGDQDENDIPREAFAIFDAPHGTLPGGATAEMLLTAAHELAHAFNLHHPDWEGTSFLNDSTIEGYSLTDTVRWQLSTNSIEHLRRHQKRLVMPGPSSLPFGLVTQPHLDRHQPTPAEAFDVALRSDLGRVRRGALAARAASTRSVRAIRRAETIEPGTRSLDLRLTSHKSAFEIGEPIELTLELHNTGTEPREALPLLAPDFGFVSLAVRPSGSEDWRNWRSAVRRDARGQRTQQLAPGEAWFAPAPIFFGAEGWTFDEPGVYEVIADYPLGGPDDPARLQSAPLTVEITAPATPAGRTARRILTEETGKLGREEGLYLLLRGGNHLAKGAQAIQRVATEASDSAQGSAANLALAVDTVEQKSAPGAAGDQPLRAMEYLEKVDPGTVNQWSLSDARAVIATDLEEAGYEEEAREYWEAVSQSPPARDAVKKKALDDRVKATSRKHRMRHRGDGDADDGGGGR